MKTIRSKYSCPKCGGHDFEIGEAYIAGSFLAKIFDIQNRKFSSSTCSKCKFTEFYKVDVRQIQNVLDFVIGG